MGVQALTAAMSPGLSAEGTGRNTHLPGFPRRGLIVYFTATAWGSGF